MKISGALLSSFFLLIFLLPVSKTAYIIHIDPKKGNDSSTCLTGGTGCATLHYAVNGINNSSNVVIALANGIHSVNDTIYISDVNNVTLDATQAGGAVLHCDGSSAGLKLVRIINLSISGIQVENCGAFANSTTRVDETSMAIFHAAVYILNSTDVNIESSAFVNNRGVGVVLYDVNGYVSIKNSNFTNNFVPKDEQMKYNGGGGLYIEHTYCTPGLVACDYQNNPYSNDSVYRISRCNFISNHATTPTHQSPSVFAYQQKTESRHFGAGGGLLVILKGISNGNKFVVDSCTFENNSAGFGGGVLINFQDFIRNNKVYFESCNMLINRAHFGGGGIAVGVLFYETDAIYDNLVSLRYSSFTQNFAPSGAGMYFFSGRIKSNEINTTRILFTNCTWYQNSGTLGAALLLAPDAFVTLTDGYLPIPEFTNCLFKNNNISPNYEENNVLQPAVGILFSSTYTMNFSSSVIFVGNKGTAISITAGSINILNDAVVEFRNNSGVHGGALALLEFASIRLFSDSYVSFINNSASEFGGAIYASAQDELAYFFSRSCFIHYVDVTVPAKKWNVSITFENNFAGPLANVEDQPLSPIPGSGDSEYAWGSSIFAVSIQPCIRASNTQITGELGDPFTFNNSCSKALCGIATAPASLEISPEQLDADGVLRLSPGENRNLSLTARDDLNNTVSAVVTASVFPPGVATVDSASIYITDSMVQINGKLNSTFNLTLHTTGGRQISTSVRAFFVDCPPGFVYETQKQKCVCSAAIQTQQYLGITRCDIESSMVF